MVAVGELEALTRLVENRPARLGSNSLVCVDGPAGSGKTTLAKALVRTLALRGLSVAALHMDDFYEGWEGLRPELELRLLSQVLAPLARGEVTRWQRYDWSREELVDWVPLAPTDVLVLEGCGSGAQAYAPYRSLLIWVEADRDTRIRRGLARDGAAVEQHWLAWMELEEAHFAANHTPEHADVRVSTDGAEA